MSSLSYENPFESDRMNDAAGFRPEWDVASLNANVSAWINQTIEAIRQRQTADDRQKIAVLLGAPGLGKTHVFGRIHHQQEERVFFVFVPQIIDARWPGRHIHWHIVESLFQENGQAHSRLAQILAHMLCPAFEAYFGLLPPRLAERYESLHQRMSEDTTAVLEIVAAVSELAPFHKLADSFAAAFPTLPAAILRALLLSLSPAALDARRWLRGEDLAEARLEELRLPQEPPPAKNVLHAIAVVLQRLHTPVVLCIDQVEKVLVAEQGARELSTELMGWLQDIPNLLMVLSCFESEWAIFTRRGFKSFTDRAVPFRLQPVSGPQAKELVSRRLKSWNGYRLEQGPVVAVQRSLD